MGKKLKQQIRGKGKQPKYKAKSHKYKLKLSYRSYDEAEKEGFLRGQVINFVDDPARNAIIASVMLENGEVSNIIACEGMKLGQEVQLGSSASLEMGNVMPLSSVPEGMYVYNVEKLPGDGGKFVRSAGTYALVVMKDGSKVQLKLPSNKLITVDGKARAQLGVAAGGGIKERPLLKAGVAYYKHRAKNRLWPKSRGVKMSAYDHPFGGKQHHEGKPTTVNKNAVPGQKVGHIRAKHTGRKQRKSGGAK
ncbi:MAG: 50S ribosomal protein L2 [Methanobacteriota archaeon]|nr:MAG: 50S ribosomal protein L2 [Euryarchaeota archaeon]